MSPSVLRLVRFGSAGAGFDAALRTRVAQEIDDEPGLRAMIAGRIGPGQDGPRLVASLWASEAAMDAAIRAASAVTLADPAVEGTPRDSAVALPVALEVEAEIDAAVAIIRVFRGVARPGELAAYIDDARAGIRDEQSTGRGPLALYLGVDPPDRFVTLSLWGAWSQVEATTGADHEHVDRTRFSERLATWTTEHYEAVPGLGLVRRGG